MEIKLDTFEKIKSFAQIVTSFTSDVNISKGSIIYDAKSIISVMALHTNEHVNVEILSNDTDEIKNFNKKMEEFV